ncbi:MAG: hypothetical protein JO355_15040 [Planctomycetaceae bacterium]|nr:hypothetical protein [Planctomycetaceae bacterium]
MTTFSRSIDGGRTWEAPARSTIPGSTPPQPTILPAVQGSADGTIAVGYYNFRMNNPATNEGAGTDAWIVFCRPGAGPTNPASWGSEVRLTDTPF